MANYDMYFFSGHGEGDCGAVGSDTTEEIVVKRLTKRIVELLRAKGLNVHTNGDKNNYKNNLLKGNNYKYKFGYTLHLNSAVDASANGIEIIVPAGEKNFELDLNIINELKDYFKSRGVKSRNYDDGRFYTRNSDSKYGFTDYYKEIREGWKLGISSGIIELCFISNKADINTLLLAEDTVCTIIANCFLRYCDKDVHPLPSFSNSPLSNVVPKYIVQAGAFVDEKNAKALVEKLKSLSIPAIIIRKE